MYVTHARWTSLAVQQVEGNRNIFRDRLTNWDKLGKKIAVVKDKCPIAST